MNFEEHGVLVRRLPSVNSDKEEKAFLREIAAEMAAMIHPSVVLDLSAVRQANGAVVRLLLHCLEEALKRNGDVRLAAPPDPSRQALESMGLHRLFQFFPTIEGAVESFRRSGGFSIPAGRAPDERIEPRVHAA